MSMRKRAMYIVAVIVALAAFSSQGRAQCCANPTNESSTVVGHYLTTITAFRQSVAPSLSGYNINGLLVSEESLVALTNYCYYSGNPFGLEPTSTVSGGIWEIGGSDPNGIATNGSNQWGTDLDGDAPAVISGIQSHASLPCTDNVAQTMLSQTTCSAAIADPYFYNTQTVTVTSSGVTNCRAGKCDPISY